MTQIKIDTAVRTKIDLNSEFSNRIIPKGTMGTVVDCYDNPIGYAVDLAIPDETLVGGLAYENLMLTPSQFELLEPTQLMVEPGYRLTLPQILQPRLPIGTPVSVMVDAAGRIILTPER